MRVIAAAVTAAVLALSAAAATTIDPGQARIQLTSTRIAQKQTAGVASTYALYNRPAYENRIGTGVSWCLGVSHGWKDCTYLLRLGRGGIVARALVPSAASFWLLGVVGGTGYYANVGGEMTVQPLGDGQLIQVNLIGF